METLLERPFLKEHLELIKEFRYELWSHRPMTYLVPMNQTDKLFARLRILSCGAELTKGYEICSRDLTWHDNTSAKFCKDCPDDYSLATICAGNSEDKAIFVGYPKELYHLHLSSFLDKNAKKRILKEFIEKSSKNLESLCLEGLESNREINWSDIYGHGSYRLAQDQLGDMVESRIMAERYTLAGFLKDLDVLSNNRVKKQRIQDSRHYKDHIPQNIMLCQSHNNEITINSLRKKFLDGAVEMFQKCYGVGLRRQDIKVEFNEEKIFSAT